MHMFHQHFAILHIFHDTTWLLLPHFLYTHQYQRILYLNYLLGSHCHINSYRFQCDSYTHRLNIFSLSLTFINIFAVRTISCKPRFTLTTIFKWGLIETHSMLMARIRSRALMALTIFLVITIQTYTFIRTNIIETSWSIVVANCFIRAFVYVITNVWNAISFTKTFFTLTFKRPITISAFRILLAITTALFAFVNVDTFCTFLFVTVFTWATIGANFINA